MVAGTMPNNLAIVLTARPSYAKLKPIIQALLDIRVVPDLYVCASALLERYGNVSEQVAKDFPACTLFPVYSALEGSNSVVSVLSTGSLVSALGRAFAIRTPRMVVVMADRHETLAASIAASYQNIPLAHLQGGETSGNIDQKVRWANTALADYHFPATYHAEWELIGYVSRDRVWMYGCPSIDVARVALTQPPVTDEELGGDGDSIDLSKPFLTVLYHPETEHPEQAQGEMGYILETLYGEELPYVVFWPGQDSGMDGVSKAIRVAKGWNGPPMRTVRTLPPERFLRLMAQTTALIGNSSAGIRECGYIGTPVYNVGDRQKGRERGPNVMDWEDCEFTHRERFPSSTLYGDGYAAPKIAAKLKELL